MTIDIVTAIEKYDVSSIIKYCELEGLHISLPDHYFFELVNFAKSKGINLFKVLTEHNDDRQKLYGNFPLMFSACMLGNLADIKYLVKRGYAVDSKCLGAVCYNHKSNIYDMIKYLCKFDIDVNYAYMSIPRRSAVSILANNSVNRNLKSLQVLLKKGGDINAIPRESWYKFIKYIQFNTIEISDCNDENFSLIGNDRYLIV